MTDVNEWGPWIEHDGSEGPIGEYVHCCRVGMSDWYGVAGKFRHIGVRSAWKWLGLTPCLGEVVRYRIKKPRGMVILEGVINDMHVPEYVV